MVSIWKATSPQGITRTWQMTPTRVCFYPLLFLIPAFHRCFLLGLSCFHSSGTKLTPQRGWGVAPCCSLCFFSSEREGGGMESTPDTRAKGTANMDTSTTAGVWGLPISTLAPRLDARQDPLLWQPALLSLVLIW